MASAPPAPCPPPPPRLSRPSSTSTSASAASAPRSSRPASSSPTPACSRPTPTPGPRQKKACAQEFAPAIEAELDRFVAPGAADTVDFEALESRLRQRALELAARAVEQRFHADRSDHTGPARPCPCGQPARYAGRRAKTFATVLGRLTMERAYYHCSACGKGFFPRDLALGMARTDLSPGVTRMTGAAAALVSFGQTSGLLDDLAGVRVGTCCFSVYFVTNVSDSAVTEWLENRIGLEQQGEADALQVADRK